MASPVKVYSNVIHKIILPLNNSLFNFLTKNPHFNYILYNIHTRYMLDIKNAEKV